MKAFKRPYFFIAHNVTSAGTSTQVKTCVEEILKRGDLPRSYFFLPKQPLFSDLNSSSNHRIVRLPSSRGLLNLIIRLFYDFLLIPFLALLLRPQFVLGFANFAPVPLPGAVKIILTRHPYLLDDDLIKENFKGLRRWEERFRQGVYYLSILSSDLIILQSNYMKELFEKKYGRDQFNTRILPNPLSSVFSMGEKVEKSPYTNFLLYTSRAHPHKNHEFVFELVQKYRKEFLERKLKVIITVDPAYLNKNSKLLDYLEQEDFKDTIINIGEVEQKALAPFYQNALALFFPSKQETFGNSLIEAMLYRLPIIVPNVGYAKAVCGEAGQYYPNGSHTKAAQLIFRLHDERDFRESASAQSAERFKSFVDVHDWTDRILWHLDELRRSARR